MLARYEDRHYNSQLVLVRFQFYDNYNVHGRGNRNATVLIYNKEKCPS
jgi:hypothetical protein